jgi:outer membrane protein TolC
VRLDESILDIARRVRDAAQGRFEAGAVPRLEVLQADLGVTRAETDLELARSTRAAGQAGLNSVLNLPPQQALAVTGSLSDRLATISYEQAVTLASSSNTTSEASIARSPSKSGVQLLRAERTPTPVFSISALFNNPPEFTAGPAAGVSLEIPLFSRNQGPIAASIRRHFTAASEARCDAALGRKRGLRNDRPDRLAAASARGLPAAARTHRH